jgi:hypothetical protein
MKIYFFLNKKKEFNELTVSLMIFNLEVKDKHIVVEYDFIRKKYPNISEVYYFTDKKNNIYLTCLSNFLHLQFLVLNKSEHDPFQRF